MRIPEADYQVNVFDQFNLLPESTRRMIERSAFATYADAIFPMIDPEIFTPLFTYFKDMQEITDRYGDFSGKNPSGRPVRTIRTLAMACLLYHESDMSKENFVLHANTDICFLYAMHATSFTTPAFSPRNFYLFLKRIEDYKAETGVDLIQKLQEDITQKMAEEMGINKLRKLGKLRIRIDSTFVDSMGRRLTRPQIIYQVNHNCVMLFTKLGITEYLLPSLTHYLDSSDINTQTYHTGEKKKAVITRLLVESFEIEKLMRDVMDASQLGECQEYQNLIRMISDQTEPVNPDDDPNGSSDRKSQNIENDVTAESASESSAAIQNACATDDNSNNDSSVSDNAKVSTSDNDEDETDHQNNEEDSHQATDEIATEFESSDGNTYRPKNDKDIKGSSLQNPNDPGATSRTKALVNHTGRVANFEEAYDGTGNSLILHAEIRENIFSDIAFMRIFLEARDNNDPPVTVITDGAYISYDIQQLAKKKNVTLIATSLTGKPTNPLFAKFEISEDGTVIKSCPNGINPVSSTYDNDKQTIKAIFPITSCCGCPHYDHCPCKGKVNRTVSATQSQLFRAQYQVQLDDKTFRIFGQERNAIEGVMSTLKRAYSLNDIQTFRGSRIETEVYGKVAAYNIKKYHKFRLRNAPRGQSAQNQMVPWEKSA